ncbi:MAG: tyrosine-type recombinase/integrase [Nanoarchaeota archaeon]|nr:tyrosine-type recombinase/integrase [Nanoarchaeota archaeon]
MIEDNSKVLGNKVSGTAKNLSDSSAEIKDLKDNEENSKEIKELKAEESKKQEETKKAKAKKEKVHFEELKKLETELRLRRKSEKTIKNYLFFNQKFLEFVKKPVENIGVDDLKAYLASLDKLSTATLSLAIASLRFFYEKILKQNLFKEIEIPKKENKLPNILSKDEIKKLIDAAETNKSKMIIAFLYSSGLRVSEIVNLKTEDINIAEKVGKVKQGKTDRNFILSDKIIEQLKLYQAKYPNFKYLLSKNEPLTTRNIQKIVKHAAQKMGLNMKITPHTLRHSFETHLIESGVEVKHVQDILGRSNSSTTPRTRISLDELKKIKSPLDTF